jgi:Bacterial protein of unknown function (DUF937)
MATSLVSEIAEVLSPTIVSRIASALGLNQTSIQKAIVAAVPALLTALISYVSKPQGATKLNDVVRKQEPGMLLSLASVIGGSGQKALIDQGASVLTSLLGGKTLSALTGAVGQYAGIEDDGSKSLMGLLGPIVLGVLGQKRRDSGLDASGLANILTSQKSNVIGALPSGFSKYLSDAGIFDDVSASSTTYPSRAPSTPPSILPWLGVLLLLALVALAWQLLSGRNKIAVETATPPVEKTTSPLDEAPYAGLFAKLNGMKVDGTDVGELATSAVNHLYASLTGIKDDASAQAQLSGLTQASSQFDQLTGLLSQLSPEKRKVLAETFASIRPNLDQLLDKALAIPGVATIIKPTVDAIRSKLDALTSD